METLAGIRDSYGAALIELAAENPRVVALASDSKLSSKLDKFEKAYPNRFFDVGVCEQNMVGMAAGLALEGKIPYISAIACFMGMRAFEIIRSAVAYPKLNVKITAMSAGFAYPQLGATHTCVEDLSLLRAASNITVLSPADNIQVFTATKAIADYSGPVYMRLGRHPVPDIYGQDYKFVLGKGEMLVEGNDASVIATGSVVPFALEAGKLLERKGVSARVINISTIKPLDEQLIVAAARATGLVVTVEEHNIAGGLGGAVAECLACSYPVRMRFIGIPNETPSAAPREVLLRRYRMDAEGIATTVVEALKCENREG